MLLRLAGDTDIPRCVLRRSTDDKGLAAYTALPDPSSISTVAPSLSDLPQGWSHSTPFRFCLPPRCRHLVRAWLSYLDVLAPQGFTPEHLSKVSTSIPGTNFKTKIP
jgi:hypothetical protein